MNLSSTESDESVVHPKGCQTFADPKGQGMTLIVPPIGFRRVPKKLFVFAGFWLAVTTLFTVQAAGRAGGRMPQMDAGSWVGLAVFLAIFWLAGLLLAATAVQGAYTRSVLTLSGAFFLLKLDGPFRTSRRRWLRTDLEGFSVNLRAVRHGPDFPHLCILIKNWRRGCRILAGRDQRELRWVAAVMSQALEEAVRQNPKPSPDILEPPADSRAILERGSDGLVLKLPAPGFRRAILVMTVGSLLFGAALMAGALAGAYSADRPWATSTWLGICLAMGLGLLGLGTAVEAVGYAFRQDELTVEGHVLTASHTTWRGSARAKRWRQSQIAFIDVDVGTNPLPRVRIHLVGGRIQNLLIYRDEDELLWVATLLRDVLKRPAYETHPRR
jgi:hypothetical protein